MRACMGRHFWVWVSGACWRVGKGVCVRDAPTVWEGGRVWARRGACLAHGCMLACVCMRVHACSHRCPSVCAHTHRPTQPHACYHRLACTVARAELSLPAPLRVPLRPTIATTPQHATHHSMQHTTPAVPPIQDGPAGGPAQAGANEQPIHDPDEQGRNLAGWGPVLGGKGQVPVPLSPHACTGCCHASPHSVVVLD